MEADMAIVKNAVKAMERVMSAEQVPGRGLPPIVKFIPAACQTARAPGGQTV